MTYPGSSGSTTLSSSSSPTSNQNSYNSIDSNLSQGYGRKALDSDLQSELEDLKQFQNTFLDVLKQGGSQDPAWNQQDPLTLHKGLEEIASSLSRLTNTIGKALEEQRHYVECKASNLMKKQFQGSPDFKSSKKTNSTSSPSRLQVSSEMFSAATKNNQMRAPHEIAMAMASKAKLLVRELKGVKQDLIFTKERCMQLEEENKRLRESIDSGVKHEEDDLVRLQLEALLAEKARLAQENATYARENQFLHEVVQYHQLKLRELAITDESLALAMEDELDFGEQGVVMDLLPLYPDDNVGEPLSTCDASQEM